MVLSSAACGGDSRSPVSPLVPDPMSLSNVIEALFLGSGPLIPSDGFVACSDPGVWNGFPRGTTVRVLVSTTVSASTLAAIENASNQVAVATNGQVTATVQTTADANPLPTTNEVTATTHPSPSSQGCVNDIGCTIHSWITRGVFLSSRALLPPSQTVNAYVHDAIGHGILGMCHIDGALIGGPSGSLMSGGPGVFSNQIALQLTDLDVQAIQAVYASSLSLGAGRAQFVAAGLIDP